MRLPLFLGASLAAACASTPRVATLRPAPPVAPPNCAALDAVLGRAHDDAGVLGVTLGRGAGERTITGDPATDERVAHVERVACVADAAAVLVRTDCGNATLVGFGWRDGRWSSRGRLSVVEMGRPGRCVQSVALVTPTPLTHADARELVVESEATSDDGDSDEPRTLRVALLGDGGELLWYAGSIALGSFDEATGAATQGRWDIVEELPLPRDLYVEQRPLHGGLGGEPIGREIRRETWRVRDRALERVDLTRERVLTPPPGAAPRP